MAVTRSSNMRVAQTHVEHTNRVASLISILRSHLSALVAAEDDLRAAEGTLIIALDAGRDGGAELSTIEDIAMRYAAAMVQLRDLAPMLDTLLSPAGE